MKRILMSLTLAGLAALLCAQVMAANATATAKVGATIVVPIAIEKTQDLEFGSIAPDVAAGTVAVSTDNVRTRTGNVNLLTVGNAPQAAGFMVMGSPAATYTITLPTETSVIRDAGDAKMLVDGFVSNPGGAGVLDAKGNQALAVGATLHVDASQRAGRYMGAFDVTVEYN